MNSYHCNVPVCRLFWCHAILNVLLCMCVCMEMCECVQMGRVLVRGCMRDKKATDGWDRKSPCRVCLSELLFVIMRLHTSMCSSSVCSKCLTASACELLSYVHWCAVCTKLEFRIELLTLWGVTEVSLYNLQLYFLGNSQRLISTKVLLVFQWKNVSQHNLTKTSVCMHVWNHITVL